MPVIFFFIFKARCNFEGIFSFLRSLFPFLWYSCPLELFGSYVEDGERLPVGRPYSLIFPPLIIPNLHNFEDHGPLVEMLMVFWRQTQKTIMNEHFGED